MKLRNSALVATILMLGGTGEATAQEARYMSCDELWYARNAIYAEAGHCFKTERGIATFGRRCFPPYGRLARYEQRRVEEIQYWEARKGCRGGY
jgi:hypothetical protein